MKNLHVEVVDKGNIYIYISHGYQLEHSMFLVKVNTL